METKLKLREARVILRDASKLMSEENPEWKYSSREREREHYEGKNSRPRFIIDMPYDLQISPLSGERNLAHQRASGLT